MKTEFSRHTLCLPIMPDEDEIKVSTEDEKPLDEMTTPDLFEEDETDEFDFGGLPDDQPFKRNIGCGG